MPPQTSRFDMLIFDPPADMAADSETKAGPSSAGAL
jgi:hypothetical protein